jgi:hypothetical protein
LDLKQEIQIQIQILYFLTTMMPTCKYACDLLCALAVLQLLDSLVKIDIRRSNLCVFMCVCVCVCVCVC